MPNSETKPPGVFTQLASSVPAGEVTNVNAEINIDWADIDRDVCPPENLIVQWAVAALQHHDLPSSACIRIAGPQEVQQANAQWRNRDYATNVLSFPADWPDTNRIGFSLDHKPLGDILICADVVNDESRAGGIAQYDHWAHIVIHGMLHLQGYDHENDADARQMEGLEILVLKGFDIANPYEQGAYAVAGGDAD